MKHLRRKSISELFPLVNGTENLKHFRFSKTVFGCVFLSGSQIYSLRVLSPLWLTAGPPAPFKLANTCEKRLSPVAQPVGLARPGHPWATRWGQLSQTLLRGTRFWLTAACSAARPKGCRFESYPRSQKFPARLLSPPVYWGIGVLGVVSHEEVFRRDLSQTGALPNAVTAETSFCPINAQPQGRRTLLPYARAPRPQDANDFHAPPPAAKDAPS
jgi:hypothetical protein